MKKKKEREKLLTYWHPSVSYYIGTLGTYDNKIKVTKMLVLVDLLTRSYLLIYSRFYFDVIILSTFFPNILVVAIVNFKICFLCIFFSFIFFGDSKTFMSR